MEEDLAKTGLYRLLDEVLKIEENKNDDPFCHEIVVGIDLGSTNTSLAYYFNGSIHVLENSDKSRITPSFVYFHNSKLAAVGNKGVKHSESYRPEKGIYEFKRLLGKKFDDKKLQKNLANLSYTVVNKKNEPVISILHPDPYCSFEKTPVEICTFFLEEIKNNVERHLGKIKKVKAVITVPAEFNFEQRKAILTAAEAAGFKVLKLLDEAIAIVLRYYFQNKENKKKNQFLIYDLGGSKFNVTILQASAGNFKTVALAKDDFLGGRNFDNLLVSHVCDTLKKKHNFDPSLDKVIFRRLQNECERAKVKLSYSKEINIKLDRIMPNTDTAEIKITQKQFEKMAEQLFKKTIDIVNKCLKCHSLSKQNVEQVIVSGGSTKIPKLQKLLSNYFGEKKIFKFHFTNCVADGAALEAAMLSKHTNQKLSMTRRFDVTPLSIGIGIDLGLMDIVIPRNTKIPCDITKTYLTIENNQSTCKFDIYTGEMKNCKYNRLLGTLQLENLTPAPPRHCEIVLTLTIEETGILRVSVKEKWKFEKKEIQIPYIKGHISDGEIQKILKDAEQKKEEDENFILFTEQKQFIIDYCQTLMCVIRIKNFDSPFDVESSYNLCRKNYLKAIKLEMSEENQLMNLLAEINAISHK